MQSSLLLITAAQRFGKSCIPIRTPFFTDLSDYSAHCIRSLLDGLKLIPSEWFFKFWKLVIVWWTHIRTVGWMGKHFLSIISYYCAYWFINMHICIIMQIECSSYKHVKPSLMNPNAKHLVKLPVYHPVILVTWGNLFIAIIPFL